MKYPAHIYAKALAEAIAHAKGKAAEDAVLKNFIALVRRNGDEGNIRKLVEEAARMVRGKSGVRKVTIETARAQGAAQRKSLRRFIKEGDIVEERIDPTLVAGVKIILDDELQFDGSLKGKMDKIFK